MEIEISNISTKLSETEILNNIEINDIKIINNMINLYDILIEIQDNIEILDDIELPEYIYNIFSDNNFIKYLLAHCITDTNNLIDLTFKIDPPKIVPLSRQKAYTYDTMNFDDKNTFIKFTKYIVINNDSYIRYIIKLNNITYYTGFIIIPNEWNNLFSTIKIYKIKL